MAATPSPDPLFERAVCLERRFDLPVPRLHVRDWPGRRGPLLCLPDLEQDGSAFDALARLVSPAWRVMVADLRGQGHSSGARHGHGFQVHATDCLALLDLLGFERVVLVGQGYGAVVALLLAAWQPERAAGLVLLDEPATPPRSGPTQLPDRAEAIRGEAWWLRVAPPDPAAVHARVRCPTLRVQASDTAPVSRPMAQPAGAQTGTEGPRTPLAGDEAISAVGEFLASLDVARRSG